VRNGKHRPGGGKGLPALSSGISANRRKQATASQVRQLAQNL
jgi:hypothetical protein